MSEKTDAIEGWAILELMGHRRLGGYVKEHEIGGSAFVRIDVPASKDRLAMTQFYSPGAVYCLTPTTESTARAVAVIGAPVPVQRWEIKPDRMLEAELAAAAEEDERSAAEEQFHDLDEGELVDAEIEACVKCGCTEFEPCEPPCGWASHYPPLCTACAEGDLP